MEGGNAMNEKQKKLAIVFDFDGTIADGKLVMFDIVNSLSDKYDFEKLDLKDLSWLSDMGARQFFIHLGVNIIKLPALVSEVKRKMFLRLDEIKPFFGIKDVILKLKQEGNIVGVLTSNTLENAQKFLSSHDMNIFDFIYESSSILSKSIALRKMMKEQQLDNDQIIYIGDEIRDIKSCRKVDIKIISVAWGFNSKRSLKENKPDYLVDKPDEILKICREYSTAA